MPVPYNLADAQLLAAAPKSSEPAPDLQKFPEMAQILELLPLNPSQFIFVRKDHIDQFQRQIQFFAMGPEASFTEIYRVIVRMGSAFIPGARWVKTRRAYRQVRVAQRAEYYRYPAWFIQYRLLAHRAIAEKFARDYGPDVDMEKLMTLPEVLVMEQTLMKQLLGTARRILQDFLRREIPLNQVLSMDEVESLPFSDAAKKLIHAFYVRGGRLAFAASSPLGGVQVNLRSNFGNLYTSHDVPDGSYFPGDNLVQMNILSANNISALFKNDYDTTFKRIEITTVKQIARAYLEMSGINMHTLIPLSNELISEGESFIAHVKEATRSAQDLSMNEMLEMAGSAFVDLFGVYIVECNIHRVTTDALVQEIAASFQTLTGRSLNESQLAQVRNKVSRLGGMVGAEFQIGIEELSSFLMGSLPRGERHWASLRAMYANQLFGGFSELLSFIVLGLPPSSAELRTTLHNVIPHVITSGINYRRHLRNPEVFQEMLDILVGKYDEDDFNDNLDFDLGNG